MQNRSSGLALLTKVLSFTCGGALVLASLFITLDVIHRRVFGRSLGEASEVSGYVLAIVSAWGFGYAALVGAHIRIDTALRMVPQPLRSIFDTLAYVALAALAVALTYYAYGVLDFSIRHASRSQTPLRVPMWIPQSLWVAGLAFFAAVSVILVIAALLRLARRDWQGASDLLDSDEVAEELANLDLATQEKARP